MTDINVALADPTTKVTSTLASGSTISSPHPALHVEERQMLESLRVKVVNDNATASAVVYSNHFRGTGVAPPATAAGSRTWLCDGVGDNVEIQAAINAVAADAANGGADGAGSVLLLGPLFMQSATIFNKTGVKLYGEGTGTMLRASQDFATNFGQIMLFDDTTHATTLSDLTLDGASKNCYGIHYIADGGEAFSNPKPDTNPDAFHIVDNIYIRGQGDSAFAGHGMRTQGGNLRACRYTNIRTLAQSGVGVWVDNSVDSHYSRIDCGSAGGSGVAWSTSDTAPVGSGFHINGDDNFFDSCKTFFSDGDGWYVNGVRNSFDNCHSQDNGGYGWNMNNGKNIYAAITSDSNGRLNGLDGRGRAAIKCLTNYNSIQAQCFDKAEGTTGSWQQQTGIELGGGTAFSDISVVAYGNVQASTGTAAASSRVWISAQA